MMFVYSLLQSLFSWSVRYSNHKNIDVGLIYLHSGIYEFCVFTVTVRYSEG